MLNKNTGEFYVDGLNISFFGRTKLSEVEKQLDKITMKKDLVYIFKHYLLKPQQIGNDLFTILLIFDKDDYLYSIDLVLSIDGKPHSWTNWSEEKELAIKQIHDAWLEKQLGKAKTRKYMHKHIVNYYEFTWGKISSFYDPKSGGSSIKIFYKQ